MAFAISYTYNLLDKYSAPLARIIKTTARFKNVAEKNNKIAIGRLKDQLAIVNKGADIAKGIAIKAAVATAALAYPIKKAADFQAAMAEVKKVVSETADPEKLKLIRRQIMGLSIEFNRTAEGVAGLVAQGGRMGVAFKELPNFATEALKAAVAFEMTDEEAGTAMGTLIARMGIAGKELTVMNDAINTLGDNMATNERVILNVLSRSAGSLRSLRVSPEQAAATAAYFSTLIEQPQVAATHMQMFFRRIESNKQLRGLRKVLQKEGPEAAIRSFIKIAQKIPEQVRGEKLKKLFGEEVMTTLKSMIVNTETLNKAYGLISDRAKFAGSSQGSFAEQSKTLWFQLGRLWKIITAINITLGSPLLIPLTFVVRKFADLAGWFKSLLETSPYISAAFYTIVFSLSALTTVIAGTVAVGLSMAAMWLQWKIFLLTYPVLFAKLAAAFAAVKAAVIAVGAALTANPLTLYVIGALALAAAGYLIYRNWDMIVNSLKGVYEWMTRIVKDYGGGALSKVMSAGQWAGEKAGAAFDWAKGGVQGLFGGGNQKVGVNGKIQIVAPQGTVKSAEMKASGGNLGFNLAGQQ